MVAAVNALCQAMAYTHFERGFRHSGIYPRDVNMPLQNHRIVLNEVITMKDSLKQKIPTVGGMITDAITIKRVIDKEAESSTKKKVKKYIKFY